MSELNRKQIIKALENWVKNYDGNALDFTILCNALALITSQEHRIKELGEEYESMAKTVIEADELIRKLRAEKKELTEENERLHASCTELTQCCTKLETLYKIECKRVNTIKANTVRKMQEIITANYAVSKVHYAKDEAPTITYQLTNWQLEQIAKEMLEGTVNAEHCIVCGDVIPEGRQVCPNCEKRSDKG